MRLCTVENDDTLRFPKTSGRYKENDVKIIGRLRYLCSEIHHALAIGGVFCLESAVVESGLCLVTRVQLTNWHGWFCGGGAVCAGRQCTPSR